LFFNFFFCSAGLWTQGLMLGRCCTTWATPPSVFEFFCYCCMLFSLLSGSWDHDPLWDLLSWSLSLSNYKGSTSRRQSWLPICRAPPGWWGIEGWAPSSKSAVSVDVFGKVNQD
jgi:hypothetical protein